MFFWFNSLLVRYSISFTQILQYNIIYTKAKTICCLLTAIPPSSSLPESGSPWDWKSQGLAFPSSLAHHKYVMLPWPVIAGEVVYESVLVKIFSFLNEIPTKKLCFFYVLTCCVKMWPWSYGSHFAIMNGNPTELEKNQPTSLTL